MKRIFLFVLILIVANVFSTHDQHVCSFGLSRSMNGLREDGFGEYTFLVDEVTDSYAGLFWWSDEISNDEFTYTKENLGSGNGIKFVVTQAKGHYEPLGVSFGEDVNKIPYYIDLSGGADYSFSVTNNYDSTIKIKIALQDIDDKEADTKGNLGEAAGDSWQWEISHSIASGETETFEGSFEGATFADYDNTGEIVAVDLTQIKSVLITIVNANQDADDGYIPYRIEDAEFIINDLYIGHCPYEIIDFVQNKNKVAEFSAYPNPTANGVTTFSTEVSNVVVIDALGNVVLSETSATELNTSSLEAGIYLVKADQGTVRLIVE